MSFIIKNKKEELYENYENYESYENYKNYIDEKEEIFNMGLFSPFDLIKGQFKEIEIEEEKYISKKRLNEYYHKQYYKQDDEYNEIIDKMNI